MKKMMVAILLISSLNTFASESITLICNQENSTATIKGVGTSLISIEFNGDKNDTYQLEQSSEGDCTGRNNFYCYQNGQMLINISRSMSLGKKSLGKVWVNLDVDDDTSNGRLGEFYNCQVN
jgi:hypothetical protein